MAEDKFTMNNAFVIRSNELYAAQENAQVRGHTINKYKKETFTLPGTKTRATYFLAKSDHYYFEDCLETAEDLINNQYPAKITSTVRSRVKYTNTPFGESEAENQAAAQAYKNGHPNDADANAKPNFGEAYVIVSMDPKNTYPYHAAAVIATDGTDRLTLEVFATDKDAKKRDRSGSYELYTTAATAPKDRITFHDKWEEYIKSPITIIIQRT